MSDRYGVLVQCLALVRLLVRHPWLDTYALADRLGVTRQTILRLLRALRQAGLVPDRRLDESGRAQWRLTRATVRAWLEGA